MSKLETRYERCAVCKHAHLEEVVVSFDALRSPARRQAIFDRSFQRFTCAFCGAPNAVEDAFMYTDFDRGQWIGCFPSSWEVVWQRHEHEPQRAFQATVAGPNAPPPARRLAANLRVRATFGLEALREKLVIFEAGLDDALVEALKLDLMRALPNLTLHPEHRPRLDSVAGERLEFVVPGERLDVPADECRRIAADPSYARLLAELRAHPYVDIGRILIGG